MVTYALRKTTSYGLGRGNLVCNAEEKMSKAILKDGMIR